MTKKENFVLSIAGDSMQAKMFFAASFLFVLLLSSFIICLVWEQSLKNTEKEALRLASVTAAAFGNEDMKELAADQSDVTKPAYIETRNSLKEIVSIHKDIRFAYIFKMKADKLYFAADSEPADSEDYSHPGQEYTEAAPGDKRPFYDGSPVILHSTDRWGTWVSILIPIKDSETGEVLAVFGIDYTVKMWYRQAVSDTIQTAVIAVCIMLLYFTIYKIIQGSASILREKIKLRENERSYSILLSNLPGMAYRCKYDHEWTMLFVSEGCLSLTGYRSPSLLNNAELSFNDLISPKYQNYLWEKWIDAVKNRTKLAEEYEIITASGETKWVLERGQAIYDEDGNITFLEGLIIDITDRKRKEDEIIYLNYHDFMTGIYNRRYLELEKLRLDREEYLPLTVMIGDINGLKLVNDALGHAEGDILIGETAKIIQDCCRQNDIAARVGGDEFMILMPFTDKDTAGEIMEKIRRKCKEYNQALSNEAHSINISLGFATKEAVNEPLGGIIRLAEESMYKRKLLEHKSLHSVILSSIKATMHEKSHETQAHAERLTRLARETGKRLKLTQQDLDELELVATLHDIGKVAVDGRILNKPDKLNEKEWLEMKRHSEIGYRIAMSSPDLVPISEYILSLHERWDGTGYPQGTRGEEIPLLSRIVSVVDAYDAMTEDRAYRKAMSAEEAAYEIRKNAGIQFDPDVVKVFLEKVLPRELKVKKGRQNKTTASVSR